MKRLVLILSLLLSAVPAWAGRALVVVPRAGEDVTDTGILRNVQTMRSSVLAMLSSLGVQYDVVSGRTAKTEFCRTGVVTYNFRDAAGAQGPDAWTRSYDAVIHIVPNSPASVGSGYRPDSLFSSTKAPLVPQLIVPLSYSFSSSACACSLGVSSTAGYEGSTSMVGWTHFANSDPTIRLRSSYLDGYAMTNGTGAQGRSGTHRAIVSSGTNAAHAQTVLPTVPLPCVDCDSLLGSTTTDSVSIVVKQHDQVPGKKPIILCNWMHNADDQMDMGRLLIGVALLDSMASGALITKPLSVGINVRGGFRRNNRITMGGISPNDSTALKASIDSLASLGVQFTVGVNVDSVATYPEEVFWWKRSNLAKFAPESWTAVNDTTIPRKAHPGISADIFGRFQSRFAVGPLTNAEGDSSIAGQAKAAFARVDSIFGRGRSDRVLIPAAGDWCPRNIGAIGLDSLWYAFSKSGATALVVSAGIRASNPSQSTNPLGWWPQQAKVKSTLGGDVVRLLASSSYPDSGSAAFDQGLSTDSYANNPANSRFRAQSDFWNGVFGVKQTDYLGSAQGSLQTEFPVHFTKTRVLTIHASDLGSGVRADAATRPTRPGWWEVKNIVNTARIANLVAWKPVIRFVPIQDIEP